MGAKITKDMLIFDVLQQNANAAEIFHSFGMGCLGCAMAHNETVGQAAAGHGVDVELMLKKLNGK